MTRTRAVIAAVLAALASATAAAAEADDPVAGLTALVHDPLAAFAAEPSGSCDSDRLAEAEMMGRSAEVLGYASPSLDVADTAAARGCPAVARAIFRRILADYVGPGDGDLRRRAEAGLAQVGAGSVLEAIPWRRIEEHAATGLIALAVLALAGIVAFVVHRRPLPRRPFPEGRLRG